MGISGNYDLPLIPVTLGLMADIVIETEKFRMGMEWTIRENIQIRFGGNETGIISTGLGLVWSDIEISYALQFEPEVSSLGNSHLLSFSINPKLIRSEISPSLDN